RRARRLLDGGAEARPRRDHRRPADPAERRAAAAPSRRAPPGPYLRRPRQPRPRDRAGSARASVGPARALASPPAERRGGAARAAREGGVGGRHRSPHAVPARDEDGSEFALARGRPPHPPLSLSPG